MISDTIPVGVPMFSDDGDERVPAEQQEHPDDAGGLPLGDVVRSRVRPA